MFNNLSKGVFCNHLKEHFTCPILACGKNTVIFREGIFKGKFSPPNPETDVKEPVNDSIERCPEVPSTKW